MIVDSYLNQIGVKKLGSVNQLCDVQDSVFTCGKSGLTLVPPPAVVRIICM